MLPDLESLWAGLRRRVREAIDERLQLIFRFTPITNTSSDGGGDGVAGFETDGEGTYAFRGQRVQHFGFSSRPPTDVRGFAVLVGGMGTKAVTIAEESAKYAPALDEGEVAIFSKASGAVVKIDKDGKITVTTATGQLLTLNGETDAAMRGTTYRSAEDTMLTALTTLFTAIGTFATAIGPAGGAPGIAAAATLNTAITTAIAAVSTFKGGASNYLSTKVKLG